MILQVRRPTYLVDSYMRYEGRSTFARTCRREAWTLLIGILAFGVEATPVGGCKCAMSAEPRRMDKLVGSSRVV